MKHPVLTVALAAALVMLSSSVSATETVADRERNTAETPLRSEPPAPPVDARATNDNLQAARKPDETPFSEIKILPSF